MEYEELWEFQSEPRYLVLLTKKGGVICKPAHQEKFSSTLIGKGIKSIMVEVLAQIKDLEDANDYVKDMDILKSGFMEESYCIRCPQSYLNRNGRYRCRKTGNIVVGMDGRTTVNGMKCH